MTKTFCSLLLAAIVFFTGNVATAQQKSGSFGPLTTEVLKEVNKHRIKIGLKPLEMNDAIADAAEKHSKDMAGNRVPFGHKGFDARAAKISKQLKNVDSWAENVAAGPETAEDVVKMWLNSPGHKKNIEGKYNLTGIGIARAKNGQLYYTQIFIHKD